MVDLATFAKLSAEGLRIHQAALRAAEIGTLADDLVARTEDAARSAGLAYLAGSELPLAEVVADDRRTAEGGVAEAFVVVNRCSAALAAALHDYAAACLEAEAWTDLVDILRTWKTLENDSVRWARLRAASEDAVIRHAERMLDDRRWSEARDALGPWLGCSEAQFLYSDSFVRELEWTEAVGPLLALSELKPLREAGVTFTDPEGNPGHIAYYPLRTVADAAVVRGTLTGPTVWDLSGNRLRRLEPDWSSLHDHAAEARGSDFWKHVRPCPRVPK